MTLLITAPCLSYADGFAAGMTGALGGLGNAMQTYGAYGMARQREIEQEQRAEEMQRRIEERRYYEEQRRNEEIALKKHLSSI
jgi:hypothetical protein